LCVAPVSSVGCAPGGCERLGRVSAHASRRARRRPCRTPVLARAPALTVLRVRRVAAHPCAATRSVQHLPRLRARRCPPGTSDALPHHTQSPSATVESFPVPVRQRTKRNRRCLRLRPCSSLIRATAHTTETSRRAARGRVKADIARSRQQPSEPSDNDDLSSRQDRQSTCQPALSLFAQSNTQPRPGRLFVRVMAVAAARGALGRLRSP
jgi:hypothetical protein